MPTRKEILDLHFMDARCKLIDLAAFIDRVERHPGESDFRFEALLQALPILLSSEPGRARAVLNALSDHSSEPAASASLNFAFGAPSPSSKP